ncbi:protein S-acyltransferase 18 [Senna tora]|uniref:S-acyltransferase n=1 Tax=Senna tora TaxID=362788 RepID=A0A834WIA5_9FABA|nr:protein S-acyltransferase 18 [Senna tora]
MRRHGWQRPLHPLQFVGMAIYSFLVVAFYTFLGLFFGNKTAEIVVTVTFSCVAISVMLLYIRCTAIDPTDKTSFRKKKKVKSNGISKLNYGFIVGQIIMRFFRRVERKLLRTFIKRKYLDPWKTSTQMDPLLPFPLVMNDDAIAPNLKEDDISFCPLCDFEVRKHSKHCRTCNRCVEGFDHHCRWLNNCVGKRNYTAFFLLMIFVLLMLIIEGGSAIAIFVRCFADKHGIEKELEKKLYVEFPRGVLATICVLLLLLTAYSSAALGQLFFFHVVLIRKVVFYPSLTYCSIFFCPLFIQDDSDFSSDDESIDFDSPEKPTMMSRFLCKGQRINQSSHRLSIRIEGQTETKPSFHMFTKSSSFIPSINPARAICLYSDCTSLSNHKVRWLMRSKLPVEDGILKCFKKITKQSPHMTEIRVSFCLARALFQQPPDAKERVKQEKKRDSFSFMNQYLSHPSSFLKNMSTKRETRPKKRQYQRHKVKFQQVMAWTSVSAERVFARRALFSYLVKSIQSNNFLWG